MRYHTVRRNYELIRLHVRHIMPLYKILHLRDTLTESYKQHSKLTQQETMYSIIQRPSYKLNCTINQKPLHMKISTATEFFLLKACS